MKQAIIYTRFSDRPDAKNSESCEYQEEFCRKWCDKHGYNVDESFEDRGVSGKTPIHNRPGLGEALARLEPGMALIVYHWDRLARDRMVHVTIESLVVGMRCHMVSASSGATTENEEPHDELLRGLFQLMSSFQRQQGAARTKHAMRSYQKRGRIMSAILPYGFERDPSDPSRMIPCDAEQEVLRRIMELHDQGQGHYRIAKTLDKADIRPRLSSKWNKGSIKGIVERELRDAS